MTRYSFAPPNILVADDDEDDRLLIEDALLATGLKAILHFVEDGEQALAFLRQGPLPSLILLDLNMPRKGGLEVLQELRASPEWCMIPVVIVTTSKAQEDLIQCYHLGSNSFVTKPLSFEALVEMMKALKTYWFETVTLPKR